jgi:hypothetical protein
MVREQKTKLDHRNSLGFANIHSSQQGYETRHLRCLTLALPGTQHVLRNGIRLLHIRDEQPVKHFVAN